MADNIPASQVQNNEQHFPKLAEMGFRHISDFQGVLVWDNLHNKTDYVFSGRSCLPGNIKEIVFPALE